MRELLNLIKFEYYKMFKKKSLWFILAGLFGLSMLGSVAMLLGNTYDMEGEVTGTRYEEMQAERKNARALGGRTIDAALIQEVQEAYRSYFSQAEEISDEEEKEKLYEDTVKKYEPIMEILSQVYTGSYNSQEFILDLTEDDRNQFYETLKQKQKQLWEEYFFLTKEEESKLLDYQQQIKTPFIYNYGAGWMRYEILLYSLSVFLMLALAICLAPVFGGEYTSKMDALILSSKYGKSKVIQAKLIMAVTFTIGVTTVLLGIQLLEIMLIYGADGWKNPIQFWSLTQIVFPFNQIEAIGIYVLCVILAVLFLTAIVSLLSAKLKSPFGVIVICFMVIIIPMFLDIPEQYRMLNSIYRLLPICMTQEWNVFCHYMYGINNVIVPTYIFIPLFALAAVVLLNIWAFKVFKKHQVA
ncbi:hypothetical protein [Anaeromicropila populeti]|uniref:ABC-type transport system involved in multi-copper enzyme maturation, permease component n=1 Tax=Anaeromicropila populeti TaxID=37658 RepID=A0A1I6IDN6_9FIRM|nr:hypothetical protein [Anaeromicropila populeti]SFR64811.1 ABC-type transport system involved in multi-copper enzyme maturation, permease component [Anaeromicropila populeti]